MRGRQDLQPSVLAFIDIERIPLDHPNTSRLPSIWECAGFWIFSQDVDRPSV